MEMACSENIMKLVQNERKCTKNVNWVNFVRFPKYNISIRMHLAYSDIFGVCFFSKFAWRTIFFSFIIEITKHCFVWILNCDCSVRITFFIIFGLKFDYRTPYSWLVIDFILRIWYFVPYVELTSVSRSVKTYLMVVRI